MDLHASLAAVSVRSMGDARKAAEAMRDIVLECTGLHVIAVDNIASKAPMEDIDGNILAADVFGWTGENEHWWKDSKLALSSPLPRACRYEAEVFCANSTAFFTRQPNPYPDEQSLDNFEKPALTNHALLVPVPPPGPPATPPTQLRPFATQPRLDTLAVPAVPSVGTGHVTNMPRAAVPRTSPFHPIYWSTLPVHIVEERLSRELSLLRASWRGRAAARA